MNIAVKPLCSWGSIGPAFLWAHNVRTMRGYGKTYLRAWRQHRGKTLVQVAEQLHMTHGQLSKIERGEQPYNQGLLEALSDLYSCQPADLIMRDPTDPQGIWSIWENAAPGERSKIVAIARAMIEQDGKAA